MYITRLQNKYPLYYPYDGYLKIDLQTSFQNCFQFALTSRIHKEQAGIRSIDLKFGDPSHLAVQFLKFFLQT